MIEKFKIDQPIHKDGQNYTKEEIKQIQDILNFNIFSITSYYALTDYIKNNKKLCETLTFKNIKKNILNDEIAHLSLKKYYKILEDFEYKEFF